MDAKKFIIEEFGLPEDAAFNKCPIITYNDIYELLTKFDNVLKPTDKEVEAWVNRVQPPRGGYKTDYIFAAKAMRDGQIAEWVKLNK
jgi:hypothetical protein